MGSHGGNEGNQSGNAGNWGGNAGNGGEDPGNQGGTVERDKKGNERICINIVLTFWYEKQLKKLI